ncbi:hypothetical protein A6M14_05465 [Acinetobacter sp. Ac_877]|nr:hypothetical protein [Acinetobacter portensis]
MSKNTLYSKIVKLTKHKILFTIQKIKMSLYRNISLASTLIITTMLSTYSFSKPTQFYKPYKSTETVENIQPRLYKINDLKVNLTSRMERPEYLNQESMTTLYKEQIESKLQEKNMLADENTAVPINLNLEINQKRVFMGEGFSRVGKEALVGNYSTSEIQYNSTITANNIELASYKSDKYVSIGNHGSYAKLFRDLTGKGKPEHEIIDVQNFAERIVNSIPK